MRLLLASLLALTVSAPALAAETSRIQVSVAELHVKPAPKSRSTLRLGQGREVEVLTTSDDGKWVQVRGQLPHWEDVINFSGWISASAIGAVPQVPVAQSSAATSAAPASADPVPAATPDAGWLAPTDPVAAKQPAATQPAAKSGDLWGDPAPSSTEAEKPPAPAATSTPAPSSDDFFATLK